MNQLTARNRLITSATPSRGNRAIRSGELAPEHTARRPGDGELIVAAAARRLDELGLFPRAIALRSDGGRALTLPRAEAAYDLARRESPDTEREELLKVASLAIAHGFAQGVQ